MALPQDDRPNKVCGHRQVSTERQAWVNHSQLQHISFTSLLPLTHLQALWKVRHSKSLLALDHRCLLARDVCLGFPRSWSRCTFHRGYEECHLRRHKTDQPISTDHLEKSLLSRADKLWRRRTHYNVTGPTLLHQHRSLRLIHADSTPARQPWHSVPQIARQGSRNYKRTDLLDCLNLLSTKLYLDSLRRRRASKWRARPCKLWL